MRLGFPTLAVLVALSAHPAAAAPAGDHADEAKRLYDKSMEVYRVGHFDEAIAYLERAYELSHKPGLLYAIAQTASVAAEPDLALDYFQRYLGAAPDAPDRRLVEARITQLKKLLGRDKPEVTSAAGTPAAGAPATATAATATPVAAVAPAAVVDSAPPPRRPLARRAWFWGALAGGVVVVTGALALGLTLGTTKVYPSSPLPPAQVR